MSNTPDNPEPATQEWKVQIFDSIPFPSLILTPDRRIVSANRAFLDKQQVSLKNVVGKTCHQVFYNTDVPCSRAICPLAEVIQEKHGKSILRQVGYDQDEEIWEDRMFSPILGDDGRIAYIMETVRDVSRVINLEKEHIGMRQFLDKVIQSSPNAIAAADIKGKILLLNPAAEKLLGCSMHEAIRTKTVNDFYPPGHAHEIMKRLRDESYGGRGKLPAFQTDVIDSHGESIPVEMTAAIIYQGEEAVATTAIFKDLREKQAVEKKLEEASIHLARSEKMASLGQLAAGVAHEINNPLTGILLYANLIRDRLSPDDALREHIGYILDDAQRCSEIVKNLLAYSRQKTPQKEILDVNNLVEQSLTLIRDHKRLMNVQVVKDFSEEMMLVHADSSQLSQVLVNLILNALDAMDDTGTLTLRTYRDKTAEQIFIEVGDTGGGISEGDIGKIFDPFFTTKSPDKGTGLGLSTSYGIIEKHGGRIRVRKTGPRGSTFQIQLPLFRSET